MALWPPPACPGAGGALVDMVAQVEPLEELDFGEFFAGKGAVHRSLQALGYRGAAMDLTYSALHDLLTPVGFLAACRICLAIKAGGVAWFAPPCSSWVWLTRHSSGRGFVVEGDITQATIYRQNAVAHRVAFLCDLLSSRGAQWIIEQPGRSVLWHYPAMESLLSRHGLTGDPVVLDMGAYGGSSPKPTHLYGTASYLRELTLTCTHTLKRRLGEEGVQTTHYYTDEQGRKRCQGTKHLKGTQAYPEGFGAAHAQAFHRHACGSRAAAPRSAEADALQVGSLLHQLGEWGPWWLRDLLGEPW